MPSTGTNAALGANVGSLTVIVPLPHDPEVRQRLEQTLADVDAEIRRGASPLAHVQGLHVARWVILPERARGRGRRYAPSLVLWTIFDGPRDAHVTDLVDRTRRLLDAVYGGTAEGYPPKGAPGDAVARFLLDHEARGLVAPFVGTPGVSVEAVRRQSELVVEIARHARSLRPLGLSNVHLFLSVREWLRSGGLRDAGLAAFAARPPEVPPVPGTLAALLEEAAASRVARAIAGAGVVCAGLLWWHSGSLLLATVLTLLATAGIAVLLVVAWLIALLRVERIEARRFVPVPQTDFAAHDSRLRVVDNEGAGLNRVTIVNDIKPGFVRLVTARLVLRFVGFNAARNREGRLQGVETIHFAQWRLVDGGQRLLFMSNYDGHPLDYFRDFAVNAAPGVNAIWGNTEGMPNTTALVGEGSRDLESFENAARMHQVPTNAWYCGYASRRLTTAIINENRFVHRLLHAFPTPDQVDEWVAIIDRCGE